MKVFRGLTGLLGIWLAASPHVAPGGTASGDTSHKGPSVGGSRAPGAAQAGSAKSEAPPVASSLDGKRRSAKPAEPAPPPFRYNDLDSVIDPESDSGSATLAPPGPSGPLPFNNAEVAPPLPATAAAPPTGSATAQVNFRMLELFNHEQLPGVGQLIFKIGDKSETIALGADTGYYAMGLVFRGNQLPDQYGRDFKSHQVIQLSLGSMRSKLQGQVPQFASGTLAARQLPTGITDFPFVPPNPKGGVSGDVAFLLFSSPTTANERSDEEKLKSTYFAQAGKVRLAPVGEAKLIDSRSQGRRISFKLQIMRGDFQVSLTTPFNAQSATIIGTIDFPMYYPSGREAEELTQRIANASLANATNFGGPQGLTDHPRDVAGSTKKDAKKK